MAILNYKNKKYELPVKNISIVEAEENMHTKSSGLVETYLKQFDFLKLLFDEETLTELLGSADVNVVDLTEVTLLCNMIDSAYMEKINKQSMEEAVKIANSESVNKLIEAGKAIEKVTKANKK